uniref:AIG1-type G domain-containing protein n=1 Tax=Xiphophorus couchianus TaxID=32473 RepID=A0A3B5L840_9TELE
CNSNSVINQSPACRALFLNFILLGRRKSGKSSAGNMILGREEFQRDKKTVQCDAGHAEISGWSVTVVDTPGWSLFGQAKPTQVRREILRSPSFCPNFARHPGHVSETLQFSYLQTVLVLGS